MEISRRSSVRSSTMENRYFRSSLRSKDSSSASDIAAREKIKDCCRKLVAFMCTQVGVGGLVVGYTVVGAFTFQYIETLEEKKELKIVSAARNICAGKLWGIATVENTFNQTVFNRLVDTELKVFQEVMVKSIKAGYSGRRAVEVWTFPAALMFSLSIITMIGYGNMVARTVMGKCVTVLYALFGIPLYILYFMNMGEVLAGSFRWVYTWLYDCSTERDENEPPRRIIVPSSASLWVVGAYVLTGAIMFSAWEGWTYLDSTYFCITSLCKIGLGDFVPGANITESQSGNHYKLVVNFVYMLVGLGLVAMCYNLMREEIRVKVTELKEDMSQCLEDTRTNCSECDLADTKKVFLMWHPPYVTCVTFPIIADVRLRSMLGSPAPPCPIRLYAVPGYDGRVNDIVYCHPAMRSEKAHTVVYFGGDMQDFTENMQSHRDSKNYLKWNLEDTARVIQTNFLDSHLIVIRPAKIEYKTFSCFKNFVPSNNCGAPEHTPMHFALQHLEKILQSVSEKLRTMTETELINAASSYNPVNLQDETDTEDCTIQTSDDLIPNSSNVCEKPTLEESFWWRENVHLDRNNLSLIGFSKGCVVLNQLLYEFHYLKTLTPDDQTSMDIVSRIKDMYWLDGGHSGGKNTWITSRPLLETFTRLGIQVHIHVTPYQIQDDRRPWIKKEEKLFAELLRRLGAPVNRTVHFENVCPNLFIHFDVINVFKLSDVAQTAAQCIDPQK